MEKKYRTQVKRDKKKVGQLAYENHWSVVAVSYTHLTLPTTPYV